jgi:hypothetical protein
MKKIILYIFPFSVDIIVGLILFLGRHSLASQGYEESTVATIAFFYGIGYVIASLLMIRIVKPNLARSEMFISLAGMILLGILLANTYQLRTIQLLYFIFPFMASLFFNSYQIFMLGVSNHDERPLHVTAGHFTTAWALGYALGPFVSSQLVEIFDWNQVYYLASFLAGLVGLVLLGFNPRRKVLQSADLESPMHKLSEVGEPDLVFPAWMGLLLGQAIWNVVMVFWPVQAVQLDITAGLRGIPEFMAAFCLGLAAFALTYAKDWFRTPTWITGLGISGILGLLVMSILPGFLRFPIGMAFYGVYSGSFFSLAVYHAMHIDQQAVKRVAINEVLVGFGFLLAFPLSIIFHPSGVSFSQSYLILSVVLAVGIIIQSIIILRITNQFSVLKKRKTTVFMEK